MSKTDRKGQITRYAYDTLGRLVLTTFDDASSIAVAYDAANRPVSYTDSLNGIVAFAYDGQDRVTEVSTPAGTIAYTYYANGQRKTMSVPGMPVISYIYDPAGRLVRIASAADAASGPAPQSIGFEYDENDRRTGILYANGMRRRNEYDDAGQLLAITYWDSTGAMIGDLRYSYDIFGQRVSVAGSLVRISMPAPEDGREYDAANQLRKSGGQFLEHDENGNLVSDGERKYEWNARDQLTGIRTAAGEVVATFTYDALGRRATRNTAQQTVVFVHDHDVVVQERLLVAGHDAGMRASYLTVGMDEVYLRLSGSGANVKADTYLTDALGSTIRLVDSSGKKLVDYAYDPYGNTTADASDTNPFQYTGRENDGVGLYYYRNRYYSPKLARFISPDPSGFGAGNPYAYVSGDPVSRTDPLGLLDWKNTTTYMRNLDNKASYSSYPGAAPVQPTARAFGITLVDWKIESRCVCTDDGVRFEEFSVDFKTNVHIRPGLTTREYNFVKRAENDHVKDYVKWANSDGRKLASETESRYRRKQDYESMEQCMDGTSDGLNNFMKNSIKKPYAATRARWDAEGKPHNPKK